MKGITSSPIPNANAVSATGLPSVPIRLTSAPNPKFTPAAINRPNDVVNANAVTRTSVPYCSGSQRLKTAKLPPNIPKEEDHRDERIKSMRQVKRPAKADENARRHPRKIKSQRTLAAKTFSQQRSRKASQNTSQRQQAHPDRRSTHSLRLRHSAALRKIDDRRRCINRSGP